MKDHKKIAMNVGMDEREADCWAALETLIDKWNAMVELHDLDSDSFISAINVLQTQLLARPAYRKYIAIYRERE